MTKAKKPRATDVARWVAILAKPVPDWICGAALKEERFERSRAHSQLASWGLDSHGRPRKPARQTEPGT